MKCGSLILRNIEVGRSLHAVEQMEVVGQDAEIDQPLRECYQSSHRIIDPPQQHRLVEQQHAPGGHATHRLSH